jgi:SAM-dependent methyltransferase
MQVLATDAVAPLEDENRAMWGRLADTYARDVEPLTGRAVGRMLEASRVACGTALLDVGTGPGTVIGPALALGAEVCAIDLTPAMIEQVRARHPDVDARVANASELPFGDECFDVVTMPFSLHHMAEPAIALAEACRVLRPGGRVALTVWAPDERLVAFGLAMAAIGELGVDIAAPPATPLDGADPAMYRRLLTAAGFDTIVAEELAVCWDLADPGPLSDLFDRLLDLGSLGADIRQRYADAVVSAVQAWTAEASTTSVPNPAQLISATRAG